MGKVLRGKGALGMLVCGALCIGSLAAWGGVALASSGGGYEPNQMDCQPFADDWATPQGAVYPGCHNLALNVESGGTTQGEANSGNTRYAELGMDQEAVDHNSKGTPTEYSVGYPGDTGSPHAGCIAVNTDGTNGGTAPSSQKPESASKAEDSEYGCGKNAKGAGFEVNFDYYEWYCPIVAAAGHPCEDPSYGTTNYTIDDGTGVASAPIVANGLLAYFGEDDNNDNTEHDGVGPYNNALGYVNDEGAENGASDGGAMILSVQPGNAARLFTPTHPEGLANYSAGFCADGICAEFTTQQQAVNHGCDAPDSYVGPDGTSPSMLSQASCAPGTPQNANVYNDAAKDPSVQTEKAACNSGGAESGGGSTTDQENCGPGGMNAIRSNEPVNEYAEPGVQTFADPDSSRSPALPSPLWPTPASYIGTCGVTIGSPALPTASVIDKTPLGNGAGQVVVDPTGC
jgi:hypothetical protein